MKHKLTDGERAAVGLLLPVAALFLLLKPRNHASAAALTADRWADILICAAVVALAGL